jgi:dihydrodipicolinate synthase/N-acetylneuraminate lyase
MLHDIINKTPKENAKLLIEQMALELVKHNKILYSKACELALKHCETMVKTTKDDTDILFGSHSSWVEILKELKKL